MDARGALLHLWTVVVLLKATLKWADAAEIYANTWAVQIDGGPEEADRVAAEHGFVNHGNVSGIGATPVCENARKRTPCEKGNVRWKKNKLRIKVEHQRLTQQLQAIVCKE